MMKYGSENLHVCYFCLSDKLYSINDYLTLIRSINISQVLKNSLNLGGSSNMK